MYFYRASGVGEPELYLFHEGNVYLNSRITGAEIAKDVPCLLDLDVGHNIPNSMLHSTRFLLQAASPNPANTEWTKQRALYVKFVLNPPKKAEIAEASVFYSLFLHL